MSEYIVPLIIVFILVFGLIKGVNVFDAFIDGAKAGIKTGISILPALVILLTCVGMFKASGGMDIISNALAPLGSLLHIPEEIIPLALLRPLSGSGAITIYQDILSNHGADSTIARIASVLMGSTETTFYTIAVYYGVVKVSQPRHTLTCSLAGDITGFVLSGILVAIFF